MMKSMLAAAVVTAFTVTSAQAISFDSITVESDNNRPSSMGDIPNNGDLHIGTIGAGETHGIGGRIVTAMDVWSFSTAYKIDIFFTDLMLGDGNSGFDSTTTAFAPGAANEAREAKFSLLDADNGDMELVSAVFMSDQAPGTAIFSAGPGNYKFKIDGSINPNKDGSTYDIAVSAVPVPAALPLLLGGLGALFAVRRRS